MTGNQLHSIESDGFIGENSALQYISLNHNPLLTGSPRFGSIPRLFSMDLSRCSFENLTSALIYNSKRLSLNIAILTLSQNDILFIDQSAFLNIDIRTLYLDNNHIYDICSGIFDTLSTIRLIDLRRNRINVIAYDCFRNIPSLNILSLSSNNLTDIHSHAFIGLPNLQTLELGNNTISNLDNLTFVGLVNLDFLDLKQNLLTHIPVSTFQCLPRLNYLNLQNNFLQTLVADVFFGSFLTEGSLSIRGNPIKCDCGVIWLRDYRFSIEPKARCFDLTSYQNFSLKTFPLNLCPNEIMTTPFPIFTNISNSTLQNIFPTGRRFDIIIVTCSIFGSLFIITALVAIIKSLACSANPMLTCQVNSSQG